MYMICVRSALLLSVYFTLYVCKKMLLLLAMGLHLEICIPILCLLKLVHSSCNKKLKAVSAIMCSALSVSLTLIFIEAALMAR